MSTVTFSDDGGRVAILVLNQAVPPSAGHPMDVISGCQTALYLTALAESP